jgi:alpha,alpha-trehalose phosphorylase
MVTVKPERATYELLDGPSLTFFHHGEKVMVADEPVERPIPPIVPGPRPSQPPGREPPPRHLSLPGPP